MKRMIYILAVVMAVGCHRSMAPWPGDGDKQDVAMYVRTRSLSGITASPLSVSVFCLRSGSFQHEPVQCQSRKKRTTMSFT